MATNELRSTHEPFCRKGGRVNCATHFQHLRGSKKWQSRVWTRQRRGRITLRMLISFGQKKTNHCHHNTSSGRFFKEEQRWRGCHTAFSDSAMRRNRSRAEAAQRQKKNDGARVKLWPFNIQMHGLGCATLSLRFFMQFGSLLYSPGFHK